MISLLIATLTMCASSRAEAGADERWLTTRLSELRDAIQPRTLDPEQEHAARVILGATLGYPGLPRDQTLPLWIQTRRPREHAFLVDAITRMLWPHKNHLRVNLSTYVRDDVQSKRLSALGAILVLTDSSLWGRGLVDRLDEKLKTVLDEERYYGVVVVIDARNLLETRGRGFADRFEVIDLATESTRCEPNLGWPPPAWLSDLRRGVAGRARDLARAATSLARPARRAR